MYQYFINAEDEKVIEYLKKLTFLSRKEIEELEVSLNNEPEKRMAQKALAREVITFIHGKEEYEKALRMTEALFSSSFNELNLEEIEELFKNYDKIEVELGSNLLQMLQDTKIANSNREAREYITGNAISINGEKINDIDYILSDKDLMHGKYIIIKRGKKNYYIGKIK